MNDRLTIGADSMKLYHGSRGGIVGDIQPISRKRCDFGKGFYMGENPDQAKGLVVEDNSPFYYELEIDNISDFATLRLDGRYWLYTVLACRGKVPELIPYLRPFSHDLNKYDFVVGPIADDRMNEAIRNFEDGNLTDDGLLYCLTKVKYGNQYVAKTEEACRAIHILGSRKLYGKEASDIRQYAINMRCRSRDVVKEAQQLFRYKGHYIDELIKGFNRGDK